MLIITLSGHRQLYQIEQTARHNDTPAHSLKEALIKALVETKTAGKWIDIRVDSDYGERAKNIAVTREGVPTGYLPDQTCALWMDW